MSLFLGLAVIAMGQATIDKEVVFTGAGGFQLKGALSIPAHATGKTVPGVLLLPGSGPSDRDGNQPPTLITDVLKQISKTLNAQGIATIRFDKRASHPYFALFRTMKPADFPEFFKWENFVADATDALKFLASQPGIDPKRLGIVGHSEGAEIALQIGSDLSHNPLCPAAIVTIGGAGRPMGPILHEQIARALQRQKVPADLQKKYMDYVDRATAQVAKDATFPPDPLPGLAALFNPTTTKLMQSYCRIDPTDLAKKYPGPVLIVNGANDTQVSAERDSPKLRAALESRGSGSVEMVIVPKASHCLKETTAEMSDVFEGPIVPLALDKIQQFFTKQLKP
ncbi:MAG: alpha/beta fold hydrolase [Fimbriimonas sp.]|nr:alpha/beta fold hydrolase [Fimbriimonas sp.]